MIYKTLHRKLKIEQHEPHSSSAIDNSLYATKHINHKGEGMIRVDFGPISETVYIDIILNTIIER
jgi:hypothetical protein